MSNYIKKKSLKKFTYLKKNKKSHKKSEILSQKSFLFFSSNLNLTLFHKFNNLPRKNKNAILLVCKLILLNVLEIGKY